ncbi:unnamed protein product [Symbiodinium natans]|uniref:Bifunctional lysine-specific demethylase and histidyl-hydroxylase n=1 Tax=Symbiodinium natans TaxID=878477 RepID=A0A812PTY1_9DINO|nr:unnamed protein product [Symbiodinium natans]
MFAGLAIYPRASSSSPLQPDAKRLEVEVRDFLRRNALGCGLQATFSALAASDTFVSVFYGRMPFVLECGDAAQSWTLEDQLKLLQPESYDVFAAKPELKQEAIKLTGYSRFTHPAIGQLKSHSFMAAGTESGKAEPEQCEPDLTEEVVRERVKNGTWVLSSGNSLSPRLAEVCQSLQSAFQVPFVTLNVYISHLDAPVTAPLHTDRFDSFIMQTEGFKRWRIYGTSAQVPSWPVLDAGMTDRGKAGDVLFLQQVGDMLIDECLKPGDILYLPRGFPHATSTFNTSGLDKGTASPYSTSLTVSLLLESVGLTLDKAMRCAAGMHEGRNKLGQCFSAEEVLRATSDHQSMRAVLPVGFLARTVAPALKGQDLIRDWEKFEMEWVEAMQTKLHQMANDIGLAKWLEHRSANDVQLRRTLHHLWRSMPIATEWCRERVYATGKILSQIPPDSRHEVEEKSLVDFPFFPPDGLMFAKSPSINSPVPVL